MTEGRQGERRRPQALREEAALAEAALEAESTRFCMPEGREELAANKRESEARERELVLDAEECKPSRAAEWIHAAKGRSASDVTSMPCGRRPRSRRGRRGGGRGRRPAGFPLRNVHGLHFHVPQHLRYGMCLNEHMKVVVCHGYYDLVTLYFFHFRFHSRFHFIFISFSFSIFI